MPEQSSGVTPTAPTVLRNLIEEARAFGRIRLTRLGGFGYIVGLPDGRETDYVVLGECGHVSSVYTTREAAVRWHCGLCAEAHWHDLHVRDIVARLAALEEAAARRLAALTEDV